MLTYFQSGVCSINKKKLFQIIDKYIYEIDYWLRLKIQSYKQGNHLVF